jgi:UDP-N-acetylglucosamine:LPS N-acetylglucosamine transferase
MAARENVSRLSLISLKKAFLLHLSCRAVGFVIHRFAPDFVIGGGLANHAMVSRGRRNCGVPVVVGGVAFSSEPEVPIG